jgi:MFS transporter, ACS family, glucarate transporter
MMPGAAPASGAATQKAKPFGNHLRKALIVYLFLIIAMSYMDRVNVSIAGPTMQKEFGLTDIQLGYIFSALWCGYALFQVPGGRLADRFGPRRVLTLGMLWAGLFTALAGVVPSGSSIALLLLIAVRFLLGAGIAVTFPASNRLVASWIPATERGIASGIILGGVGGGSALAPPLITWIILSWGWRWAFFLRFPAALLMAVLWYWLARDTPRQHPWIDEKELGRIEAGVTPSARGMATAKAVRWGAIFGNRSILLITTSYFAFGYTAFIFFTWFFKYVKDVRGLDLKASAFYSMLPFLGVTVCSPLGGWISDLLTRRFGPRAGRCGLAAACLIGAALFIALGTQAHSGELASVFLAVGIGTLYLSHSSYWSVAADMAGSSAGSVSGLMNMGAQVAGAITATLTPMIAASFGWTVSFLVPAALCALGAIPWLLVDPAVRIETEGP